MNYSGPSGHGILSKAWKKVKSMAVSIFGSVRGMGNGKPDKKQQEEQEEIEKKMK